MNKKIRLIALVLGAFAMIGAGCAKQPASNNTSDNSGIAYSDTCGNPYYPFKPGLTIAYKVTPATGAEGSSDFTTKVVSVTGTTAAVQVKLFGGVTTDMTADCASGSVALKGSTGLGSDFQGMKFKTTVVSSSGSSMPANVSAGTTWDHSEILKMEVTGGNSALTGSTLNLTTTEQGKAIDEESVTVPAGTYKAMKIEIKRTTETEFSGSIGASLGKMKPATYTSTEWWVKGIGMVKTVTVGQDGTSTTEAKSISGQ